MDPFTILSGVGSLFGGLGSLFSSSKGMSQEDLLKWQEQMLEKQFGYQSAEAEKNRLFQSEQAQIARNWNSIGSQLRRADDAGVNPYALVGSGNYGSASGASAPSGSMVGTPSMPEPAAATDRIQRSHAWNYMADSILKVSQSIKNVVDARKTGVDTEYVERSMNDLLAKVKSDANYSELLNNFQSIINKYADKKEQRTLDEIFWRTELMSSQYDVNVKEIDKMKAEIFKLVSEGNLNVWQRKQVERFLTKFFDAYQQSVIEKNRADARASDASAVASYAAAEQSTAIAANTQTLNELNKLKLSIDKASNQEQKDAAIKHYANAALQADIITNQMKVALDIAIKNKNWFEVQQILKIIETGVQTYSSLRGSVSSGGSSGQRSVSYTYLLPQ